MSKHFTRDLEIEGNAIADRKTGVAAQMGRGRKYVNPDKGWTVGR